MESPGLLMMKSAFLLDLEAAHTHFTGVHKIIVIKIKSS